MGCNVVSLRDAAIDDRSRNFTGSRPVKDTDAPAGSGREIVNIVSYGSGRGSLFLVPIQDVLGGVTAAKGPPPVARMMCGVIRRAVETARGPQRRLVA